MNDTGVFGGGEFLAFLIFAIIFGGGGWNGLGGWGNRGNFGPAGLVADTGIQAQLSQIQDQMSANKIESTLDVLQSGMTQGFAGLNTAITTGIAGLVNNVNQGFGAQALQNSQNTQSIINAICSLSSKMDANTIAELSANNAALRAKVDNAQQTAVFTRQISDLAAQLAACCCKIENTTPTTAA